MAPVLGYWNIRGLCQPIRLLLNYVGQEYEEKYYVLGPAPDYNMEEWMGVKFTLGLPFPNVPYWIDGDTKLVQSHAILKYLARKHNLCPTSEQEIIRCDMLEHQLQDLFMDHALVCYSTFIKMGDYARNKKSGIFRETAGQGEAILGVLGRSSLVCWRQDNLRRLHGVRVFGHTAHVCPWLSGRLQEPNRLHGKV
ncbi:glutathione S-transferase B isoform X2 [Lingula anatina]|uniref:glutathione transferase n=1 Tax=Lingula anatina TaxID=7574 RepID=A0A1S3JPQ4_LINAN|nr:glutathione S-transferase B isoform X2 [Lingula anatina]|eukprot:XP_013412355.1 glutathione S-transferase B isoform X2 [Lingula anatina]